MIIVEGPDGAGKTTLVHDLRDFFDPRLRIANKVVDETTRALDDLVAWTEGNVQRGFQDMLFDRHRLISEPIYGPVIRPNNPEPGFDDFDWLTLMNYRFRNARPCIIYCLPPLEEVQRNIWDDIKNEVIKQDIEPIYRLYTERAARDCLYFGADVFDYTAPNNGVAFNQICQRIEEALRERGNSRVRF